MEYSIEGLSQLIEMLEDEATGKPIDRKECRRLALIVGESCPVIVGSLRQIVNRSDEPASN